MSMDKENHRIIDRKLVKEISKLNFVTFDQF